MLTDSQRAALALRLRKTRTATGAPAPPALEPRDPQLKDLPLSFGQEQLWFLDRFAPGQAMYNIPIAIGLDGALDMDALQAALAALAERHETLRTRLVTSNGRPVQRVDPPGPIPIATVDLTPTASLASTADPIRTTSLASTADPIRTTVLASTADLPTEPPEARLRELIDAEALRPFDLATGPLMRVSLIRLGSRGHILLAIFHHAIFDGWSATVLLRELAALYRQCSSGEPAALPDLPIQFPDYALWERARLTAENPVGQPNSARPNGGQEDASTQYWREVMDGFETVRFPADRPRPLVEDWQADWPSG